MFDGFYSFLARLGYPHPIHPTEVHMPIGLIVAALVFRIAAPLLHRPALIRTALHCTVLAGIFLFPTMLFGVMDWQYFYHGAWLFAIKVKLPMAIVSLILVFANIWLAYKRGPDAGVVFANYVVSFLVVVVLGYFGGNLVYGGSQYQAPPTYAAGMKVFNANCAGCHPKGGNIINPALPLANSAATRDFTTFLAFIRHPSGPGGAPGAMPPFPPAMLSEQDAKELYGYITHTLEQH